MVKCTLSNLSPAFRYSLYFMNTVKANRKTVKKASGLWGWPKLGCVKTSQVVIHMAVGDFSSWQGMTGLPDPAETKTFLNKNIYELLCYVVFTTLPWHLPSSLPSAFKSLWSEEQDEEKHGSPF